jgi:NADPH:quinone reductase
MMRAAFVVPEPTGGRLEVRETEIPQVAPGRVLVRVKASGLNRGEVLLKHAALKGAPYIGGVEFASALWDMARRRRPTMLPSSRAP